MTIKEALEEICNKQIPKEVNGISTKYVIEEKLNKDVVISIAAAHLSKKKIAVTRKYRYEQYICCHFDDNSNGRRFLEREVHDMLCWYIRIVIEYTDNNVVKEIHYSPLNDVDEDYPYDMSFMCGR